MKITKIVSTPLIFCLIIIISWKTYIILSDECVSMKLGVTENFVSSLYLLIQSSTLKKCIEHCLMALATLLHVISCYNFQALSHYSHEIPGKKSYSVVIKSLMFMPNNLIFTYHLLFLESIQYINDV